MWKWRWPPQLSGRAAGVGAGRRREISTIYDRRRQCEEVMEVKPKEAEDRSTLEQGQVITGDGARVTLLAGITWA
ncbi:hypothetical protein B1218_37880, partial [Pseudomonas ogarae]